jgi:hypothetical protein
VNPLIIVIAAAAVLVVLLVIVVMGRFRHTDESERFRHVSDLTSAWSRQQHPELAKKETPRSVDLGPAEHSTTDSVDSR